MMLQILHGAIASVFMLAAFAELANGRHRRPPRLHRIAVTTAFVTSVMNLWAVFESNERHAVLLWTIGVFVSYTSFLRVEARLWTFNADCGCFGKTSGSIRTAIIRNAVMSTGLALVVIIQWVAAWMLLVPTIAAGFIVGLLAPILFGPTRLLAIQPELDGITGISVPSRLLALNSRCGECVNLAQELAKRPLPPDIDGVLTDHTMRIKFHRDIHRYRPADAMAIAQLPTPCLIDLREDGAVTDIRDYPLNINRSFQPIDSLENR